MATAKAPPTAATRLLVPEPRGEAIARQRLLSELQAAARRPLTVVRAPAGYGKTTALAQWLGYSGIEHAWLSLSVHDNDPRWFAARLLAALDRASPGRYQAAQQALNGGSELGDTVIPLLVNALAERSGEWLAIVLDDYHLITDESCHEVAGELIDVLPFGVGVVVASRAAPPLRLARRRAAGTLAEIGPEQLRFDTEESERLLNDSLGLQLEPAQIEQIDARVNGWAAGLALIASALPERDERAGFLDELATSQASLDAYLIEEVLQRARPELQDFLCRTSILDRLSPALCEAVLDDPRARELLAEVRRDSLFVTVLDHDGSWVRYHHLFADTLTREFERREPKLVAELHRRACEWFGGAGMPVEAIDHAIAAGDGPQAASLLASAWPALINDRRAATVRRILDRLPDDRGELGPFCEALDLLCMTYEGVDVRITHERCDALAARAGDDSGVRQVLDNMFGPFGGDVGRALEIGREAWERYADDPDTQLQLAPVLGTTLWFAGEYEEARRLLEPRLRLEQPSLLKIWTLGALAMTGADEGDPQLAEQYAREATAEVEAIGGQTAPEFAGVSCALAEALRLRGKLDEARHHLDRGLENEARRPGSIGHALALTYDAQLALAERDRRRAQTSATRARRIIDQHRDVGTLETRLAAAEAALHEPTVNALLNTRPTRAELRVLALLDSDRTLDEIAAELCVAPSTVKSHVQRLYRRLGESTRTGALAAARDRGLLADR